LIHFYKRGMVDEDYSYILVEQYATEVLDFSSQYGSDHSISYTAHNITGMPTKFPSYGDFSQTYVMRDYGPWWTESPSGKVWRTRYKCPKRRKIQSGNFIDIKYEHSVYPIRIHIYETYNPGGVSAIWAGNCRGDWKLLWESTSATEAASQRPRIFSPPLQQTSFKTKLIRIEFNQSELPYYTEIDAVALLGTLDPISNEAKVNKLLPDKMGKIMQSIVDRRLHILPQNTTEILENCHKQLHPAAMKQFTQKLSQREKSAESHLGYFCVLPYEILMSIFGYLDLRSLVQISAVSKQFRELSYDPYLYRTVDLRDIFNLTSDKTLDWLRPRCSNLSALDMSWCGNYGKIKPSSFVEFLEYAGPSLQFLRLDNCHVATRDVLEAIVRNAKNLKDLSLGNCHLLNLVDFHVLTGLTNLESLNLYRTTVGQSTVLSILCGNRNIRNLCLACCPNIDGDDICIVLSHCQTELECLDLWRCSSLTDRGILNLATCSKLRDLDIGWCLGIQVVTGALVHLIESCPELQRLYLTAHRQTGDRELIAVAKLKHLEQLDILGNRNVTLSTIQELLAAVPSLKLLDASFCELGDSNVLQLRRDYPNVDIKWSFTDVN